MNRSAHPASLTPPEVVASALRHLPSVDRLLADPGARTLIDRYGRQLTVAALRARLNALRQEPAAMLEGASLQTQCIAEAGEHLARETAAHLRAVFNLTGTVLHTNLGRALLPAEAIDAMRIAASEPVNLEYSIRDGKRGDRDDLVESLLRELTGAQAATVVNNNAAAVLLSLHALAAGRQAILARGEMVEIGGAFRIPDIMRRAQVKLVEVGTTNRTRLNDYEQAITSRTALLMKVHTSNYVVNGFTESTALVALSELGKRRGVPVMEDLGSGALIDLSSYGLPREPIVRESVAQGAELVTFSGDKLLGGPQAGIIVGRQDLIDRIKRNPLKRALRVDKVTLAALEAVLRLYQDPDRLAERLPTLRLLSRTVSKIEPVAQLIAQCLVQRLPPLEWRISVAPCASMIGSGSQPVERLPSMAVVIRSTAKASGRRLVALETQLRGLPRPVIGRIHADAVWLDCRMIEDASALIETLTGL